MTITWTPSSGDIPVSTLYKGDTANTVISAITDVGSITDYTIISNNIPSPTTVTATTTEVTIGGTAGGLLPTITYSIGDDVTTTYQVSVKESVADNSNVTSYASSTDIFDTYTLTIEVDVDSVPEEQKVYTFRVDNDWDGDVTDLAWLMTNKDNN